MSKPPKRPRDPNQLAKLIVDVATGSEPDQPRTMVSDAQKRASIKGGTMRAERLTSERRTEIAAGAAKARWKAAK